MKTTHSIKDTMLEKKNEITHPSFGKVSLSRVTCGSIRLFGSNISHNNFISLRVYTAKQYERFSETHQYPEEEIVEVYLSPAQYAELITTLNIGTGVPCTINKIQGESIPSYDFQETQEQRTKNYYKDTVKKIAEKFDEVLELSNKMIESKTVPKKDRKNLENKLKYLKQCIDCDLPFIEEIFNEKLESTVLEVKSSLDSYITDKVTKFGLENINTNLLLEE